MPKYIIFDIDDTLVSNPNFNKYIPKDNTREAWDIYLEKIDYYKYAECNKKMIDILNVLAKEYTILFVTSREHTPDNRVLNNTYNTLKDIIDVSENGCELFMRDYNDFRPSWRVKEDLFTLHGIDPKDVMVAIDDNIDNINMFKRYGINTVHITLGDNYEDI